METFLSSNPGLRSRFNKYIHFSDYQVKELEEIFQTMCKDAGYIASTDAQKRLSALLTKNLAASGSADFGNARGVRNILELSRVNHANRVVSIKEPTLEQLTMLEGTDIPFSSIPNELV